MAYELEYTDTFAGEANYCWVKRALIAGSNSHAHTAKLKREAKAAMGLTGVRGKWSDYGDTLEFRPRNACTVLFVTWHDCIGKNCPYDECTSF